jgi:peptide/nickel transport system permease protein
VTNTLMIWQRIQRAYVLLSLAGPWRRVRSAYALLSLAGKLSLLILIGLALTTSVYHLLGLDAHRLPSGPSLAPPSWQHPFGTDDLGMDLLAQICYGAGISLIVGLGTAILAGGGGTLLGMAAGYYGRWVDKLITGLCDVMMCIPHLPMMIVMGAFFGSSLRNIILVLALISWAAPARIARARTLAMKQERYVTIAKSYGANFWHLTARHFLPAIFPIAMVSLLRIVSAAIVAEAGLAFLGLGDPTSKSWGIILNHSINFDGIYFTDYWKWWIAAPLFFLIMLVTAIAMLGRDLERVLDTKA